MKLQMVLLSIVCGIVGSSTAFGAMEKYFEFPEIPPMVVWHETTYEFSFSWPEHLDAEFSFECEPLPDGVIDLSEGADGVWAMSYTPDAADTTPLMVTLTGVTDWDMRKQSFELIPSPHLADEQLVFDLGNHMGPGPFQAVDIIEHYTNGSVADINNQGKKQLKRLELIGQKIIWEDTPAGDDLVDKYNGKLNQELIKMTADTVIIRSPLNFPQTNVVINARVLKFEGSTAKITTTPNVTYPTPAQSKNGYNGWPAGYVVLNIEQFDKTHGGTKFDLRGSKGQNGGPGKNGDNGFSVYNTWTVFSFTDSGIDFRWEAPAGERIIHEIAYCTCAFGIPIFAYQYPSSGDPGTPTDGTDAIAPGKPGNGGAGGILNSTIGEVASYTLTNGGAAGNSAGSYSGGNAGYPRKWLKMKVHYCFSGNFWAQDSYANYGDGTGTKDGKDQPAKYGSSGSNGYVAYPDNPDHQWTGDPQIWIDPILMANMFYDAKDLYLAGDLPGAQAEMISLCDSIKGYKDSVYWNNASEMNQYELTELYDNMQMYLYQIENRMDYFGHPAGWVPMLSFEVNFNLFNDEIDRSIEQLYLTHWVTRSAANSAERFASLEELRSKLEEDIIDATDKFETAQDRLPGLRVRAEELKLKAEAQIISLRDLEFDLAADADKNLEEPWWKTGLKIAGNVVKQIPFIQPLGESFYIAADFNTDDPYGEALKITGVADQMVASAVEDIASGAAIAINASAGKEGDAIKGAIQMIGNEMPSMTEYLKDSVEVIGSIKAPASEIQAEIERLKAHSPRFAELSEQMDELLAERRDLANDIAETMLAMNNNANIVRESLMAKDALQDDVASLSVPDDRALEYLEMIERRAFDRLLKYHYYVAKAYEYRLLEEYTEPLDLEDLFYELSNNTQVGTGGQVIPADQFESLKGIYTSLVSEMINKIASEYNENGTSTSAAYLRMNLTEEELARLNAGETIVLNLMELTDALPLSQENARILDISILDIQTSSASGSYLPNAYVDIQILHGGLSKLVNEGQTYLFQHFADNTTNPAKWGAWYYPSDSDILPVKPSPSETSLLYSVLNAGGTATSDELMLYSRPAIWSDLLISKKVYGNGGNDITLDSLRLEVYHDFETQDNLSSIRTNVMTTDPNTGEASMEPDLMPYFNISTADINGRVNGRGAIRRTYYPSSQTPVEIQAQRRYGNWKFWRWIDQYDNVLTTERVLSILPDDHKMVKAQYVSLDVMPGDLNYDCEVDIRDLEMCAGSWTIPHGQRSLDESDKIGMVNIMDLGVISSNWMAQCNGMTGEGPGSGSPEEEASKKSAAVMSKTIGETDDSGRNLIYVIEQ